MAYSSKCFDGELVLKEDLQVAGLSLLIPSSSLNKVSKSLQELEILLSKVGQDPPFNIQEGLYPVMKALIAQKLLWHPSSDIRFFVVSCLNEITRITAPDAPYEEEKMKEIFLVTIRALDKLYGASGKVMNKAIRILHNIAEVRSCLLMLDLGCHELIVEMFELFFGVIGSDLPRSVISDMETIMTLVIEESDEISSKLVVSLLKSVTKETGEPLPRSSELGESILKRCAGKLKPCLPEAVRSTGIPLSEFPEIVSLICQEAVEWEPSAPCENLVKAYERSGKKAINEEAEQDPAKNTRNRRPNFILMRPEEGYSLPTWSKGESTSREKEMEEHNAKFFTRPLYIKEYGEEQVGKKIRVWWPLDQTFSEGTISAFDPISMTHTILHDDGDEEMLDLREERWERIETTTP